MLTEPVQERNRAYSSKYFTHIFIWDKFSERIYMVAPYYKKIADYRENKIFANHLPVNCNP
jgi:hypothetical protein